MNKLLIAGIAVGGYLVYRHFTIPPASGTMTTLPPPSIPPPVPPPAVGKSPVVRLPIIKLIPVSPGIPPVPAGGCPQGQAPGPTWDESRKAWVQTCR